MAAPSELKDPARPMLQLVGKKLSGAEEVADHYSIFFDDGSALHIYNALDDIVALGIVGRLVVSVDEQPQAIVITLDGGESFGIDLRDNAFQAPEAFIFHDAISGVTVVETG